MIVNEERNSPNVGGQTDSYWQKRHAKFVNANEQTYRDQLFKPFTSKGGNFNDNEVQRQRLGCWIVWITIRTNLSLAVLCQVVPG